MKKLMGAAILAGAAVVGAGPAHADGFSGSISLTSDYVFRGISQTDGGAAIQGSLDYSQGIFSAGLWGSNVNFGATSPTSTASMELDAYIGLSPTTGPINWDLTAIGYFYPNADDSVSFNGELDYYEGIVGASTNLTDQFSVGAKIAYSPEYWGEYGDSLYYELNAGYAFNDAFSVSAAWGNQDVDLIDDYNTWNVGATYATNGFTFGVTYSDSDAYDNGFVGDESLANGRLVFSVGRSL
jgi:uncharacterized protein (TIGR02001 family)